MNSNSPCTRPHRYLVEKKSPEAMARIIEDLMIQPPQAAEK
jgi:hypothetical protein